MDKIMSARVDEDIIRQIGVLAKQLDTTKKNIIERAVKLFSQKMEKEIETGVFDQTFGTWRRNEKTEVTVRRARKHFQNSALRYQK
jgi:predicted transcriptional regulator